MKRKLEKPILAEGEVTGHAHVLDDENIDVYDDGETREFAATRKTGLRHEEHRPIELPPGEYESGIVVEYDPFEAAARKVRD